MPDNFGYIYDWIDQYEVPDEYTQYTEDTKNDLMLKVYGEMTAGHDDPLPFEDWKKQYGHFIELYNPAQEVLSQEEFDIKSDTTEKLFTLKTDQLERDYDLINKYNSIDDSDDFESLTEMSIRHNKEDEKLNKTLHRYESIAKGKNLNKKKKLTQNKQLLNSIRSGSGEQIIDELNEAFWDDMRVVRSKYDQDRLNKTQALDSLILNAAQTSEKAFKTKEDSLSTLLVSTEAQIKNAGLDLIQDKISDREEYDEELWTTVGELAGEGAFEGRCTDVVCEGAEVCNEATGKCGPDLSSQTWNEITDDPEKEASCSDGGGEWTWMAGESSSASSGSGMMPSGFEIGQWCCIGGSQATCDASGTPLSAEYVEGIDSIQNLILNQEYDKEFDFNNDGEINILDIEMAKKGSTVECPGGEGSECEDSNWGQECPACEERIDANGNPWTPSSICNCGICGCSEYPAPFN